MFVVSREVTMYRKGVRETPHTSVATLICGALLGVGLAVIVLIFFEGVVIPILLHAADGFQYRLR